MTRQHLKDIIIGCDSRGWVLIRHGKIVPRNPLIEQPLQYLPHHWTFAIAVTFEESSGTEGSIIDYPAATRKITQRELADDIATLQYELFNSPRVQKKKRLNNSVWFASPNNHEFTDNEVNKLLELMNAWD